MAQIRVHVRAGARRESIAERATGGFDVCVREEARGGSANARVIEIIAVHFDAPRSAVRIVSGHRGPHKRVRIEKRSSGAAIPASGSSRR